ncbi:glycine zipper 2TM domain-containing protein [Reyranella sp. CPCC 100927]|uniref:glycine zipper 2TM domain-containing protein n=1 Tax=Reyranella sp. CPCC 100927 TaxID=2599616 RepID=UPI0011B67E45|nr:glycine zipper 2TM domain-containing protein [Reyranella sp. CPCC 100927]TWT09729.1 glycine zipper 2TM domain-containing protein [Reyranella sp. CPCC 100927]
MSAKVIARMPAILAAAVLSLSVTACGPSYTGETYSRSEMQRGGVVQYGRIISVDDAPISGTSSGLGTLGGGVAGGTIGAALAHGRTGSILAGVGGAIIGAVAGNAIERGITAGRGTRFIVQVDNGPVINVVQTNEAGLQTGERVMILEGGEKTRLAREGSPPPPVQ